MRLTRFKLLLILSCISVGVIFLTTGGLKIFNFPQKISQSRILPANNAELKVTRVIDGDTIEVDGGWRVRYIGINAPESVTPSHSVDCYGPEASLKNKELIEGQTVRLVKDTSEKDEYGRLLRYIYKGNTMVNIQLVKEGFAKLDIFPPDVGFREKLLEAQTYAINHHLGLWGRCVSQ